MIERLAEIIRKYQVLVDLEKNADSKKLMSFALAGMKEQYDLLSKENREIPPEVSARIEMCMNLIENIYNKRASN